MLKSLGNKAEAFEHHYSASSQRNLDQVKEVCFDIQVQLVEFLTTAVKSMRGEEDEIQHCKYWQTKRRHSIPIMW